MDTTSIIIIAASYFLGSIPVGLVVAKLAGGADPRTGGSGNIGATNVSRTLGKGAGIATLIGDALKGALPVYVALYIIDPASPLTVGLTAFAAFIGHLFPVFLAFRGGKGVATALGVMVVISPLSTLICALIFVVVAYVSKYVSLGSMYAAVSMPLFLGLLTHTIEYVVLALAIAAFIVFKHRANIKRIKAGTENTIR